ncbi:MAG: ATP-binding protein [Kofleriaceae bacterium]
MRRPLSLRLRMVGVFGVLMTAVALFMIGFFPARMEEQAQDSTEAHARTMTQVMASALAPALEFDDADNAAKILAWLASSPDARFAVVVDDAGNRFATWSPAAVPPQLPSTPSHIDGNVLITSAPVVGRGADRRGNLYVGQSLDRLAIVRATARNTVFSASIVVLIVGLLACFVLATALVRPLERLTAIAHDIARGAKPPRIIGVSGSREVIEMTGALGTMLDRLNEANRQLVDASRHAGMAEVATGVLHNVGNILTSVNVAIESLNERVSATPVDRVRRAGELLAASAAQPTIEPAKIAAGASYLGAIAENMHEDRTAQLAELATLRDHIAHVNRVVTMQNGYARTGGLDERVELTQVVDEAIALGCPDPERHGIVIIRRVEAQRIVTLDRHRVLQILVNLCANARDSVTQHHRATGAPLRITVSVEISDAWIELRVDDSGGGITPESLRKIFHAGFTTKPRGHGYGLHSSALAAEQLGGTLRCASEGIGHGASFVLRVPNKESV